jgi:ATP-binding cassette subfamily B protein
MLVEKRVSDAIKMDLFRKVVTSDIQFFEHYNSGELAMLFNRNVSAVRRAATGQNFTNPLKQIIKGFGHTYALYLLSPEITYYLLLLIPFYMISDYFFHIFNRAIDRKEEKKMAKRSNISSEIIQGIATVKAFNTEDKEIASYQKHVNELSHQLGRRSLFHIAERTVHEILNISKVLIVLGLSQQIMLAQMGNQ